MQILNDLIVLIGVFAAGTLMLTGTIVGIAIAFRPNWEMSDRWMALAPMAVASALSILGLALAKWAISIL